MTVTLLVGSEPSTANTDNNVRDMIGVAELEPDAAPLTQLMDKLGSKPARNPKIEWLEDEGMPRLTTLTASAANNATAFGVAADIFRVGDVLRIPAYGFGLLVSATAAGAITAAKIGGTAQTTASNASEVFIVANANAEGASLREIKYSQLVTASNYCQIVRTPFGVTQTEQDTEHYSGEERARLRKHFGIEHAKQLEAIFLFGPRDLQNTNQRTSGGIKEFLSTNVTADTGGLAEADWQTFLQSGFRYGSRDKVALCSPKTITAIEGFARANTRVNDNAGSRYGIKMATYESGQGSVGIVNCRWFNDSTIYGGYAFLVDMDAIKMRPLSPTRLLADREAPDYDGVKDEYRSEVSLQVTHERRHALLTGVT